MSRRTVLKHATRIAAALALLAAVVASPIRPSSMTSGSPLLQLLPRHFGNPPTHSIRPSVTVAASRSDRVKAVESEDDKVLSRTARPDGFACAPPLSPALTPARESTAPVLHRATRPLRC
jgi:hypothetical protein